MLTKSIYRLYVQATDHGIPPRSSSSVLDIWIQKPINTLNLIHKSKLKYLNNFTKKYDNYSINSKNYLTPITYLETDHSSAWNLPVRNSLHSRSYWVSFDLIILIAMITATLASLVLILILFIIVRCRRIKSQQNLLTNRNYENSRPSTNTHQNAQLKFNYAVNNSKNNFDCVDLKRSNLCFLLLIFII